MWPAAAPPADTGQVVHPRREYSEITDGGCADESTTSLSFALEEACARVPKGNSYRMKSHKINFNE